MKRIFTLSFLAIAVIMTLAAAKPAAADGICMGFVKHDGVPYQGAVVKIYKNGCLAQTRVDTTDANGYFCALTILPAGNYEALITNAPHLNWVSFYYDGTGYTVNLGTINLYPGQGAMQDCRD